MRILKIIFLVLIFVFNDAGLFLARADVVYLKNGRQLEGLIKKETDEYVELKLGFGTMKIYMSKVKNIKRSGQAEKEVIQKQWQAKAQENKNRVPQKKGSQTFGQGWDKPRRIEPEEKSSNPGESTVDYKKRGSSIIVEALLNNDVTANLVVDTGATTVLLSREIAEELGNNLSWGSTMMVRVADGRTVHARRATLKSVIVGDMEATDVSAAVLDEEEESAGMEDGLLGMSFLKNFVFHIDAQNNSLVLESK